jgi:aspartate/methionine/tyrosine aminotransferase
MNELVRARMEAGQRVVHLAFGEAGLPVHPSLVELLREHAGANRYGAVAGAPALREAVAGYLGRRGVPSSPELIAMAPGSKPALFALISAIDGDVVIPRPSWVSYAAHAALAGRAVVRVPTGTGGGVPDAAELVSALDRADAQGLNPGIMVLTVPDNPTGTVAEPDEIARVLDIASERGLAVISDEIYRDLAFDQDRLVTPGMARPDEVFVTGGLSKSLALGGWRIGFARFPDTEAGNEIRARVLSLGSELWSCLSSPVGEAARFAFGDPPELTDYLDRARRLHRSVNRAVYDLFIRHGAHCHPPQAAFYLYPDLDPLRGRGAVTPDGMGGGELARLMLDDLGVAVLPGTAFGDLESALRFRVATSLLYGSSDAERLEAMASEEPTRLPWIAGQLAALDAGLAALSTAPAAPGSAGEAPRLPG